MKLTPREPSEAERLANTLEEEALFTGLSRREHLDYRIEAAAELRRLQSDNERLAALLESEQQLHQRITYPQMEVVRRVRRVWGDVPDDMLPEPPSEKGE